ncbi:aminotransferase class V-fold PLP-dependent enzyme [Xylocopilactobacillus apicola]|uniref:cysteine desulfurase n=1 Tax=Xylocopilactobacillus apicola TaxID=2932184 RepID=A0AAU9DP91_9LACO|nr:aminotransferase class V-fold PLP-dependent enzyme [Xylocopilactobacillus apicola]BDR57604.1 aminotransferase V [Xylocopilactobacillus apicola]
MIYLDNAATTLIKPSIVGKKVFEIISSAKFGNPARGSSNASVNALDEVFKTRKLIRKLFNLADPSLTAFTNNATEALNFAIKGLLKSGDHVIATTLDHNSVLRPIYQLEKTGIEHDFVGLNKDGSLDYNQFERLLKPNTKMVVCPHASNVTGEILDLKFISDFCHQNQLLMVVDAAQTAGVIPIDVRRDGIDVLCFTGHKSLFGPQGTGGICLSHQLAIEPLISGGTGIDSFNHDQPAVFPEHLEAGTLNVAGIAGLGAGIEYVLAQGIENSGTVARNLADRFIAGIKNLPQVKIYGNLNRPKVATVSLNLGDINSAEISDFLQTHYDIATRAGAHCAPLLHCALKTKDQGMVRFSFSSFNQPSDVDQAVKAIKTLSDELEREART